MNDLNVCRSALVLNKVFGFCTKKVKYHAWSLNANWRYIVNMDIKICKIDNKALFSCIVSFMFVESIERCPPKILLINFWLQTLLGWSCTCLQIMWSADYHPRKVSCHFWLWKALVTRQKFGRRPLLNFNMVAKLYKLCTLCEETTMFGLSKVPSEILSNIVSGADLGRSQVKFSLTLLHIAGGADLR